MDQNTVTPDKNHSPCSPDALKRKLGLLQLALFFFMGVSALFFFLWARGYYSENLSLFFAEQKAPYHQQVKKIIEPLQYSGVLDILAPDSGISVDFSSGTWELRNIHHFDKDGRVALRQGKYGLCGDLAAYVYDKIRPLFDESYTIEFVKVAESGYFLNPRSSHIALLITRPSFLGTSEYILDPSFHRYGLESDFDDYLFFGKLQTLEFVENKSRDERFRAGAITPVLIKNDFIVGLTMSDQDGRFDRDNFTMALTATRRFKYSGRYLFALRKASGVTETFENAPLAHRILDRETYEKLREKIIKMHSQI